MDLSKQSLAQHVKLKCRVCSKEIYRKNYKSHLQSSHPAENCDDLSPLGQFRISSFFHGAQKNKTAVGEVEGRQDVDTDKHENLVGDSDTRKRRHESGESIESGYFDEVGSSSAEKKKKEKTDDPDDVTLHSLNDKLDKILEEVKVTKKATTEKETKQKSEDEVPTALLWIKHSRSMPEILEAGFEYEEDSGLLSCTVCRDSKGGGTFYYSAAHGLEFDESEYLPRDFSNLKKSIIRHIEDSKSHFDAISDIRTKEKAKKDLISKNRQAGMNLGRLCMEKYIRGRPYTDYETDVLLLAKSGATVGELNHSRMFPAAFRPSVTKTVHSKVKKFL